MSKKLTQDEFIERMNIKNNHFELVSDYIRTDYPIYVKCKIHSNVIKCVSKAGSLITSKLICEECDRLKRENEFKEKLKRNNSTIELLSNYTYNDQEAIFRCTICNNEFNDKPRNIISSNIIKQCPICKKNNQEKYIELKHIELEKIANLNGYKLLEKYKSSKDSILCECKNGHLFKTMPSRIQRNTKCLECFKSEYIHLNQSRPFLETHPELSIYLKNKNDAEKYSYGSSEKVYWYCPDCRNEIFRSFNDVTSNGFACKKCSDGYSYPNKFMSSMLKQLDVKFNNEFRDEWTNNKIFDFLIDDKKLIIEMDGQLHSESCYTDVNEIIENDILKDNIAILNGYNIVRIDCNYNNVNHRKDYIMKNILNSGLSKIYDLSKVDWDLCDVDGNTKNINIITKYWNNGFKNIREISEKLNISLILVQSLLKLAAKNDLIDESIDEMKYIIKTQGYEVAFKKQRDKQIKRSVRVRCNETGEIFNSIIEAKEKYPSAKYIWDCISEKRKCIHSGKLDDGTKLSWTKIS